MKTLIALVLVCGFTAAQAEGVSKKVCHVVKGRQVCKTVKVHKKFDGTVVPTAPAKKKK
jgi:hypothetical protein